MKTLKRLSNVALIAAFTAAAVFAQTKSDTPKKLTVSDLAWFTGCWEFNLPERNMTTAEHWMKPAGGSLVGMSRTVAGEKTAMWEFMRIAADKDGVLNYIVRPSSSKEDVIFKLASSSANEVVFENAANDFPQRIIYRRPGGGTNSLFARIENLPVTDQPTKGMDIPMVKGKCD